MYGCEKVKNSTGEQSILSLRGLVYVSLTMGLIIRKDQLSIISGRSKQLSIQARVAKPSRSEPSLSIPAQPSSQAE